MKGRKLIYTLLLTASIVLSACRQASPGKEDDKQPSPGSSQTEGGDNILIWKVALPIEDFKGFMDEQISIWQETINTLLQKKNAGYSVRIEVFDNPVADALESLRNSKEQTDVISLLSATQENNLAGYCLEYPECAKRNLLMPLDELLDSEKGTALRNAIPAKDLERAKLDDVTYGLSAVLPAMRGTWYSVEQMKKYGIKAEELEGSIFAHEDILQKIKDLTGKAPYGSNTGFSIARGLGMWIVPPTETVALNKDGKFVNVTETPEYRDYLAKLTDWKEKGLLEITGESSEPRDEMFFAQPASYDSYSDKPYQAVFDDVNMGDGTYKEAAVLVVPDETKPVLEPYWGDNKLCIASWTKNQEKAEDFLIRLLTDPEIANAVQYGREGTDYTLNGEILEETSEMNLILRHFGYQYTNPLITYSTVLMTQEKQEYAERFHETYETGFPDGFRFDPAPVAEQIVATNNIMGNMEENTIAGNICRLQITDVDKAVEEISQKLKKAGIDKVVAEANRQLEEWKKVTGK